MCARGGLLLLALLAGTAPGAAGQEPGDPGRPAGQPVDEETRISEYDFAVSHAMRALMATGPEQGRVSVYVARKEGPLWHVYFGSYDIRRSAFRIAYEVVQKEEGSEEFVVGTWTADVPADEELDRAATALVNALDVFEPRSVRFYTYVWRDTTGRWVTYFAGAGAPPGPVRRGIGRPGVDQRVVLSPDARRVLESRAFPGDSVPRWIPTAESLAPTVADFFHFFLHPHLAPLTLIGRSLVCEVDREGRIDHCLIGPPR